MRKSILLILAILFAISSLIMGVMSIEIFIQNNGQEARGYFTFALIITLFLVLITSILLITLIKQNNHNQ